MPIENALAFGEKPVETTCVFTNAGTKTCIFLWDPYHETLKRFDPLTTIAALIGARIGDPGDSNLHPIRTKRSLFYVGLLTFVFESITALLRFGFGLESSIHTASTIGVVTFGIRVHHGYIGALLLGFSVYYKRGNPRIAERLAILGLALLLSDLIHHFLVLWPLTGDPQFHLVYPE